MTAQPRFSGLDTAAPPEPSAAMADAANHAADAASSEQTPEVQPFMPQPPWQVRHARKLIAAAMLVVIGLAYGAHRIWQFYIDPADRIAAAWRQGKEAPVPAGVPPAPVAVPAPVRPAPAVVPAAAPVLERQAEPIVSVSRRIPAVTHTRREPAPVAATAAVAPAARAPVRATEKPPACAEQIVVLGLCTPEREVRK